MGLTLVIEIMLLGIAASLLLGTLALRQFMTLRAARDTIAELRRLLTNHKRETDHYGLAVENADDGILMIDLTGRILWANPAYCRIMGRTREELLGQKPMDFAADPSDRLGPGPMADIDPDDPDATRLKLCRQTRPDGTEFWNQISMSFRTDANGARFGILVSRDVTEQIEHEERLRETRNQLEFAATHDGLTQVANRSSLMAFARAALETGERVGSLGLLHIDLDKFKAINDTHGHSAGDRVLVHVSDALKSNLRKGDLVARVGGDEFVVVCRDVSRLSDLEQIGYDLSRVIAQPFTWEDRIFTVHASIGAALAGDDLVDPEILLSEADFALYEAKRAGRARVAIYDKALHDRHMTLNRRAADLNEAVTTGDMAFFFQPKLDMSTGSICGLETLVRWNHPKDGLISPADFLPMAADLGLMGELDLLAMSAALDMRDRINWHGHHDVQVSLNASSDLLVHPDFIPLLIRGVEARNLARRKVVIEVLETTVFGSDEDGQTAAAVIRDLRDAGFQVMLDDFGVGYAGLGHLATLAVTGVKIDQSLVRGITRDETSSKIVRTIVELCSDLGLDVIAEGVETHETARRLYALGCRVIQGYLVAPPLEAEGCMRWLAARNEIAPLTEALAPNTAASPVVPALKSL